MEAIIAREVPRDEADKTALECAGVADRRWKEQAKPHRPIQTFKDGIRRAVAAVYGDELCFDEVIRSPDGAKAFLRDCGRQADEVESTGG
jgi:hypothetical protein